MVDSVLRTRKIRGKIRLSVYAMIDGNGTAQKHYDGVVMVDRQRGAAVLYRASYLFSGAEGRFKLEEPVFITPIQEGLDYLLNGNFSNITLARQIRGDDAQAFRVTKRYGYAKNRFSREKPDSS